MSVRMNSSEMYWTEALMTPTMLLRTWCEGSWSRNAYRQELFDGEQHRQCGLLRLEAFAAYSGKRGKLGQRVAPDLVLSVLQQGLVEGDHLGRDCILSWVSSAYTENGPLQRDSLASGT